jgi:hypothetical protein
MKYVILGQITEADAKKLRLYFWRCTSFNPRAKTKTQHCTRMNTTARAKHRSLHGDMHRMLPPATVSYTPLRMLHNRG